jgi:hypothetical protein
MAWGSGRVIFSFRFTSFKNSNRKVDGTGTQGTVVQGLGGGKRKEGQHILILSAENFTNYPLFSFTHSWKNSNLKNKKVGKKKKKHNKLGVLRYS